jgi:succinoglycan biosynthesis protein ExoW
VRSALGQTHALARIVVVDDGSPRSAEAELAVLAAEQRGKVQILHQKNAGPGAARNTGLDALEPNITHVAFLDSDDIWMPDHIARAMQAMEGGADLYFTDYRPLGSDKTAFQLAGFDSPPGTWVARKDLFDALLRRSPVGTSTVVFRRALAITLRFSTEFHYGEDVLFWMRLAIASDGSAFSARPGAVYGRGVNIAASARWGQPAVVTQLCSEFKFHSAVRQTFELTHEQTKFSRKWQRTVLRNLAFNVAHLLRHRKPVDWMALSGLVAALVRPPRRASALRRTSV